MINVFSAGNSGYANASVRSALPYFQPDLEGHWLAVSGLDQQNGQRYNRCGIAKYWCITTPGRLINSTMPGGGYANKSVPRWPRPTPPARWPWSCSAIRT